MSEQSISAVPVICAHCGRPIIGGVTIWCGTAGYHPQCMHSPYATEPCPNCAAQAARIAELEQRAAEMDTLWNSANEQRAIAEIHHGQARARIAELEAQLENERTARTIAACALDSALHKLELVTHDKQQIQAQVAKLQEHLSNLYTAAALVLNYGGVELGENLSAVLGYVEVAGIVTQEPEWQAEIDRATAMAKARQAVADAARAVRSCEHLHDRTCLHQLHKHAACTVEHCPVVGAALAALEAQP